MAASATASYLWEDPADSIAVHISLDVVERLGASVIEGLGPGPRGVEIGGVLLGRTAPGGRTVWIEDFALVASEHLRGASYTLSAKERHTLGSRLARRKPGQVVGYFRSHTRPGLYLDQDDFAVISDYFQDPSQVVLVVRPAADHTAVGGFFFWEDGDINRRSPYRQFPFERQRLLAGDFPIADVSEPQLDGAPRRTPAPVPQGAARIPRRPPQVPWLVVPVIAGMFLIAGLFKSQRRAPQPAPVPEKASAPAPVPEISRAAPAAPGASQAEAPPVLEAGAAGDSPPPEIADTAPGTPAVQTAPQAESPRPPAPPRRTTTQQARPKGFHVPGPPPVTTARISPPDAAPPPTLAAPVREQMELAAALAPHIANLPPPPEAEVSYTTPHSSVFRRVLHKIPALGDGDAADALVPPTPVRKVSPAIPRGGAAGQRSVDVKVYIDESGGVWRAQLLTKRTGLADASLSAARQWRFTPARKRDKPVSSEMVLHFRFGGVLAVD